MSLLNDITLQRFWSKITVQPNGCWNFDHGFQWDNGYPCFWFEGKSWRANRLVLWLFEGAPPQNKPHSLHKCNNPECVNPAHLYWGDGIDNHADLKKDNPNSATFKSQFRKGHQQFWNGNRVLLNSQVEYIKRLIEAGYCDREIGRWYGVTKGVIKGIRLAKTYNHVNPYTIKPCGIYVDKPEPSRSGKRTLTTRQVLEIRSRFGSGESKNDIAKAYGVCQSTVHKIVTGRRWLKAEMAETGLPIDAFKVSE